MNRIAKYNTKSLIAAFCALLFLLCLLSYGSAPDSASFLEAVNPLSALVGVAFVLTYCGLPVVAAVVVEGVLLFLIFYLLHLVARRIFA